MIERLYTAFPISHPGIGLFLLRFLTGGSLVAKRYQVVFASLAARHIRNELFAETVAATALLGGFFMIAGFATSIVAIVATIAGLVSACSGVAAPESLFLAALSFIVALLGPGAWSVDARLFGWRQIRFTNNTQPRGL